MSFERIQFLSGWAPADPNSRVMNGRKAALEIENNGGDFLIFEYAYPGREEERSLSVTLRIFDQVIGQFQGFYSYPFYIGFEIPPLSQERLTVTLETDHSYFRANASGEQEERGLILFHMELLNRQSDPDRYRVFEAKAENLKAHFSALLTPSQEAQPLPIALLIEPTGRCNMNCVMCARSIPGHPKEEEGDLPEDFVRMLGRAMGGLQAARVQGLGEPLISSAFVPLMNALESNQVQTVTFNTNGYLLDETMARFLLEKGKTFEHFRISFSLDAATQETYGKIRGKDLRRTLKNIRFLQEIKKRMGAASPSVFINMTLSRTNIRDLPGFIEMARDLDAQVEINNLALDKSYEAIRVQRGADVVFDYKNEIPSACPKLYNRQLRKAERLGKRLNVAIHKAGDVAPMEEPPSRFKSLLRFKKLFGGISRDNNVSVVSKESASPSREKDPAFERLPLCLLPWSQMVISSKGDISLCCVQGFIDHLKHYSSVEEAWHSEKVSRIREQLSRGVFPPECETADCTVRRWKQRVCVIHQ